jgi:hypothetical protein
MGDLRKAMQMFQQFMISGHTDASKILAITREKSLYTIPVHEFIKSIALGDLRHYHSDASPLLNLYTISDESRPSHFTKLRLLGLLYYYRNRSSSFGQGFISIDILEREFARIGTSQVDLDESLKALASYSAVENELYEPNAIGKAYRITPAGRYYSRDLAARFAYLDLVLQDTPIADPIVFEKILSTVEWTYLEDRFTRVHFFVQYLVEEEAREYTAILHTSEAPPLRRGIGRVLLQEFEKDREMIRRRVAERGPYASSEKRTPYGVNTRISGSDRGSDDVSTGDKSDD